MIFKCQSDSLPLVEAELEVNLANARVTSLRQPCFNTNYTTKQLKRPFLCNPTKFKSLTFCQPRGYTPQPCFNINYTTKQLFSCNPCKQKKFSQNMISYYFTNPSTA